MNNSFNLKFQQSAGIITGSDRFSESIGDTPTHTVLVATLPSLHQTVGFLDERDRVSLGFMLAAAPDVLAALKAALPALQAYRSRLIVADEAEFEQLADGLISDVRAAIAKAGGTS